MNVIKVLVWQVPVTTNALVGGKLTVLIAFHMDLTCMCLPAGHMQTGLHPPLRPSLPPSPLGCAPWDHV